MNTGPKTQVAGTNDCSIHSKYSIVAKGYVDDPYLNSFVAKCTNRSPIINRGYYVRHRAIEYGFGRVFSPECTNVVVTLGAGFDTSSLRYPNAFFIELDYPSVCHRKAAALLENGLLPQENVTIHQSFDYGLVLESPRYLLIGADLRKSGPLEDLFDSLSSLLRKSIGSFGANQTKGKINFILFNECSLCYIEQEYADSLLKSMINCLSRIFSISTQISFSYLGYEMLRSESCLNDFGQFLLAHFDSLGAGILTFISETDIQRRFMQTHAFDQLEIINMKQFWREHLNKDEAERNRIRALEPFDEFEELDNVCASYSLTIGMKSVLNHQQKQPFIENVKKENSDKQQQLNVSRLYRDLLPIFGHASHLDTTRNRITIFGGFGLEPKNSFDLYTSQPRPSANCGHRRYSNIIELCLSADQSDSICRLNVFHPESKCSVNRVHAQVVSLDSPSSSTSRFLLSGGRTSPATILPNAIIEIDSESSLYHLSNYSGLNQTVDSTITPNAFRHVCSRFGTESGQVIQLGGITRQCIPPETVFLLDINFTSWTTHRISGLDTARHSVAFTSFQDNCLLLHGGLDSLDNFACVISPLELIDSRECKVNRLQLKNGEQFQSSLYSHRLHPVSEYEVLSIGGIGAQQIENVFTLIDLRTVAVVSQWRLECPKPDRLLMHNFTCHLTEHSNGRQLCILGGGGNCFSFGTHFNPVAFFDLQ